MVHSLCFIKRFLVCQDPKNQEMEGNKKKISADTGKAIWKSKKIGT